MEKIAEASHYSAELSMELATRFLFAAGIGMPARRPTCLLELQRHVVQTFGRGAPKRVEQINRALYDAVLDWFECEHAAGRTPRRLPSLNRR